MEKFFPHILPLWKATCKPLNMFSIVESNCFKCFSHYAKWIFLSLFIIWTLRYAVNRLSHSFIYKFFQCFTSWINRFLCKALEVKTNPAWASHQEHSFTFCWNFSIVCWTVLSAAEDKKHRPFELVLRSRGRCVSKRPSSWMGGTFDLGVLFTHCNVIAPGRVTPLICDQWES